MHGCLRKIHEDILVCWKADLYMSASDSCLLTVAMICMHAHMHTHTHAHMHTHTHAHTHTCTHAHMHTPSFAALISLLSTLWAPLQWLPRQQRMFDFDWSPHVAATSSLATQPLETWIWDFSVLEICSKQERKKKRHCQKMRPTSHNIASLH